MLVHLGAGRPNGRIPFQAVGVGQLVGLCRRVPVHGSKTSEPNLAESVGNVMKDSWCLPAPGTIW